MLVLTPNPNQAMSVKQRFLQRFSSQEEHELRASGRIKKQKTVCIKTCIMKNKDYKLLFDKARSAKHVTHCHTNVFNKNLVESGSKINTVP